MTEFEFTEEAVSKGQSLFYFAEHKKRREPEPSS
jgi:hypothetical protein